MQKFYRFLHSNDGVRKNSSSGGAFTLISDSVLDEGGVVYGCIMDGNLCTRHSRADNKIGRDKMRGSKYIQSDMKDLFPQIKKDLQSGYKVLFSGTPCQSFAVEQYLQALHINTDNLVLLEIICHGVGSKLFFNDYRKHLENQYKGKAVSINFRAKFHKGQKQDMAIEFDNGKIYHASSTKFDWFYSVYLHNLILRPCCYNCPFARKVRYADLTIADHWGYREDESYSLVISNSEQGDGILNKVNTEKIDEISETEVKQPHMQHPCDRPLDRDIFWKVYLGKGYLTVQRWYGNNTVKGKVKDMLARCAHDFHLAGIIKHICKR